MTERENWIIKSKRRCQKMGLEPNKRRITNSLSESALIQCQKYNELFIEAAFPYMKICSETFKLCGSILVLTDRDGYILMILGPESIIKSRIKLGLGEGGSLREEDAGTNAVALTLKYLKPIYVEGNEYYLKIFQSGACFCAPVFYGDVLLGTIVIVHPEKKGHPHTFALIKILASLIEQEYKKLIEFNFFINLSNLLNLITVATGYNGNILWLSERAKKILNILPKDKITKNFDDEILRNKEIINEVFKSERLAMSFLILRKEYNSTLLFILEPVTNLSVNENRTLSIVAPYKFDDIVGLKKIKTKAHHLALQNVNLSIVGESGTGKELLASAIHNASLRGSEKFVVVNCAAIPETLFESELFGYKKGAFTDARYDKLGKIEYANNGTLFFDEIAELPLDVQAKLLRVLEDKKVIPLGSNEGKIVNVRFIFATNQDLEKLVEQGKFREDLYYRINSPIIKIPPLRERREEIPDLIAHLLQKIRGNHKGFVAGLTDRARECLINYDFPGNARQLEGILRQAFLTCNKEYIDVDDLGLSRVSAKSFKDKVDEYCRKIVLVELQLNGNNIDATAKKLKISRRTIYRYLKKSMRDIRLSGEQKIRKK